MSTTRKRSVFNPKIVRQEVHWVPEGRVFPWTGEQPRRVWTLWQEKDPNKKPELPFTPLHRTNAWLEDHVHDWNIFLGKFRYGSRVEEHSVWILCEFAEKD